MKRPGRIQPLSTLAMLAVTAVLLLAAAAWTQGPATDDIAAPTTRTINDTTMVRLREMCEWAGAKVEWEHGKIIISRHGKKIAVQLGSNVATVGNQTLTLSEPVQVIGSTAYMPIRTILEALGAGVTYKPDFRCVLVTIDNRTRRINLGGEIEQAKSNLGNFAEAYQAGIKPSLLGWGSDDKAYPDKFIVNPKDGAEMVWVPAGEFQMGITPQQKQVMQKQYPTTAENSSRFRHEMDAHTVNFDHGFWLYRHKVTNQQFVSFLNEQQSSQDKNGNRLLDTRATPDKPGVYTENGRFATDDKYRQYPVHRATWYGANLYAEANGAALPTEAQWEYAAKGPSGNTFPWGNEWDRQKCPSADYWADRSFEHRQAWLQWLDDALATDPHGDNHLKAVSSFPASASWCGAVGLAGAVREWCADWYGPDYYSNSPENNPHGPQGGSKRVMRGGSWFLSACAHRCAARTAAIPEKAKGGFRCAIAPGRIPGPDGNGTHIEKIESHLGRRGPAYRPGRTPAKIGWGNNDRAYPDKFVVNPKDGAEMSWIPPGQFIMGSDDEEVERALQFAKRIFGKKVEQSIFEVEQPAHEVHIPDGFWMYRHEVTNAQYAKFDQEHDSGRAPRSNLRLNKPKQPVTVVCYRDGKKYAQQMGARLPTEAEWEYACRAGTSSMFWWGNEAADAKNFANVADYAMSRKHPNRAVFHINDGYSVTAPVGSYRPNDFGLYDTLGNVWEWCADGWAPDYYANSPEEDPPGAVPEGECPDRILRGGGWWENKLYSRCRVRLVTHETDPRTTYGFRCVIEP